MRPTPALSGLGTLIASFEGVGLDVESSIDLPPGFAEPSVGVTVYRVVQESLTNAHRYGTGTAIVDVGLRNGRISVTVQNTVGDPPGGPEHGSGLRPVGALLP